MAGTRFGITHAAGHLRRAPRLSAPMKVLFTCCVASLWLLLGAYPSHAAQALAVVNFSVERGQPFSLLLDGQPVTRPTAQQVHLDNVAPGEHQVELSLGTGLRSRGPRIQAAVWLEEGLETSFVLTQRPGYGWQLRQVSTVALPGYGYQDQPGSYGQPAAPGYGGQPGNAPVGPASYPPVAGPGYPAGAGYPPAGAPGYPAAGSYPAAGGYLMPLGRQDAADLVRALRQCSFDDKRLPLFYQAVERAYVRADDLAAIVRAMTYAESQQKVAEFGYSHLADPQNFHRVLAALTFPTDASRILDHLGLPRQ
jgi:hypothetical protein